MATRVTVSPVLNARIRVIAAVLVAGILGGCGGQSPTTPAAPTVSNVAVTGLPTTIFIGQTAQVVATASLSDGSAKDVTLDATWQSSNTFALLALGSGSVRGVGAGDATLQATYGGKTGVGRTTVSQEIYVPPATCGQERWAVKTLSDSTVGQVLFDPANVTSISALNSVGAHCSALPEARTFVQEFQTYEVIGRIVVVRTEDDHDYHLALADPSDPTATIVTELADPECQGAASSPYRSFLVNARNAFAALLAGRSPSALVGMIVRVRGVGFFDFDHGQTGRARSCMELHPVISIEVLPPG